MSNRCITIAFDANRSKCITVFILLLGGPDEPYYMRDHILTQARIKFRIKEPFIIYPWGGEVAYDGETLPKKVDEVLVSKGEAVKSGFSFYHVLVHVSARCWSVAAVWLIKTCHLSPSTSLWFLMFA
jgi:hypothetical protein